MFITRKDNELIMSENLVCTNYSDMKHFGSTFERVGDNEYKCTHCGTIMVVKEPVLVHDEKGRLKMQVSAEYKREQVEFLPGSTLDEAVRELLSYREKGKLVVAKFNGVTLYSDTVTLDSAYRKITGKTKAEFDEEYK
jgi:hypothetical protein